MSEGEDPPRFLSSATCQALVAQIRALGSGRARTQLSLSSKWRGDVRWARNRLSVAGDWRQNAVSIFRSLPDGTASVTTNQVDPASLHAAVQWAERELRLQEHDIAPWATTLPPEPQAYPRTHIWSDTTYTQSPEARSAIAAQLISGATRVGMLSAGYLAVEARGTTLATEDGRVLYAPQTLVQCSLTVRDPAGTGSGWAGASSYDWTRFDAQKLAEIALDKCLRSRNPVAIEPGRYTLILEPQATFDLAAVIMRTGVPYYMGRELNEGSPSPLPFRSDRVMEPGVWFTRIGERVLDTRLGLTYEPEDPDLGVIPFAGQGDPYVPVTWFDRGVLRTLSYDRDYARERLHVPEGAPNSGAFRMSGGTDTIAEMIAATKRGLLVTRFWSVKLLDEASMLCTGVTRDGLWLIEHGNITKAVKNLRFTESPMFAFNQVEQLGVPVPVFSPEIPAVVPPMKVRDFSFTSLTDAV